MPSLTTYRQTSARRLGSYAEGTATSGSTSSIIEIATSPFISTIEQDDRYTDWWVMVPAAVAAADRVARRVKEGDASTGQFTIDNPVTTTPNGLAVEFHGLVEPYTEMRRLINDTLKLCLVMTTSTFTVADADDYRHSLAAITSLTKPEWIYQVGYLTSSDDIDEDDPFILSRLQRGRAYERNGIIYLHGFRHNTSDTMYVLWSRPAYTYIRASSAGAFGDTTAGLTSTEANEAKPDAEWVAAGVKMLAWDELGQQFAPGDNTRVQAMRKEAADQFRALSRSHFKPPRRYIEVPDTPSRDWGPASMAAGRQPLGLAR